MAMRHEDIDPEEDEAFWGIGCFYLAIFILVIVGIVFCSNGDAATGSIIIGIAVVLRLLQKWMYGDKWKI
jgi:hypothetical protein